MRTVIILGCMCISDSINKDWLTDEFTIKCLSITIIIMMSMDIAEFIKNLKK